jgi:N-acetylneuraminic acid mutarotase
VAFENNIYVFGGYDGVNRKNDFYKYNIETNTWQQLQFTVASSSGATGMSHIGPIMASGLSSIGSQ